MSNLYLSSIYMNKKVVGKLTRKNSQVTDIPNNSSKARQIPEINKSKMIYTMEEAIEAAGFGIFQIKLICMTGFAYVANAMEMMILTILAPALSCDWGIRDYQKAFMSTIVFVGMVLSGLFWGTLCDRYGRKWGILLSACLTFYFGFLSTFSPTYIWILITRSLVGFGAGGVFQSFVLLSEFSPKSHRARISTTFSLFWPIGVIILVGLAIFIMPNLGWRYLLGISSIPIFISAVSLIWLPESPRFYLGIHKPDIARKIIKRVSDENKSNLPDNFELKPLDVQAKSGRISDLFAKEHRFHTIILWLIWFGNMVLYYGIVLVTTEIFKSENACVKQIKVESCDIVCLKTADYVDIFYTTIAEFPGLLLAVVAVDLIGRKYSILLSYILVGIFILTLNLCVARTTLVGFLFVVRCFLSTSWQALIVYTPEYYPTAIRSIGLGSCSSVGRIGAIITPFIATVLYQSSPHAAVSLYGGVSILCGLLTWFLPETKGRELKDHTIRKKDLTEKF